MSMDLIDLLDSCHSDNYKLNIRILKKKTANEIFTQKKSYIKFRLHHNFYAKLHVNDIFYFGFTTYTKDVIISSRRRYIYNVHTS